MYIGQSCEPVHICSTVHISIISSTDNRKIYKSIQAKCTDHVTLKRNRNMYDAGVLHTCPHLGLHHTLYCPLFVYNQIQLPSLDPVAHRNLRAFISPGDGQVSGVRMCDGTVRI